MGKKNNCMDISSDKLLPREDPDMATKGNLRREIESLLIAAQNNAIKINYVRMKIHNTQQNSKYEICGDRDETINPIISEYNKQLKRECKTRHDRVGKVIHSELYMKAKFNRPNMHKPESVLENETHRIL